MFRLPCLPSTTFLATAFGLVGELVDIVQETQIYSIVPGLEEFQSIEAMGRFVQLGLEPVGISESSVVFSEYPKNQTNKHLNMYTH